MPRIDKTELLSGLLIAAIGAFFYFGAMEYRMGTMTRMGPGMVPHWLGAIGMGLGALIILTGVGKSGALPRVSWREFLAVVGAITAFGLILPRFGLVPAVFMASVVSILGNPRASLLYYMVVSSVVAFICWGVFIGLLGLSFRAFSWSL